MLLRFYPIPSNQAPNTPRKTSTLWRWLVCSLILHSLVCYTVYRVHIGSTPKLWHKQLPESHQTKTQTITWYQEPSKPQPVVAMPPQPPKPTLTASNIATPTPKPIVKKIAKKQAMQAKSIVPKIEHSVAQDTASAIQSTLASTHDSAPQAPLKAPNNTKETKQHASTKTHFAQAAAQQKMRNFLQSMNRATKRGPILQAGIGVACANADELSRYKALLYAYLGEHAEVIGSKASRPFCCPMTIYISIDQKGILRHASIVQSSGIHEVDRDIINHLQGLKDYPRYPVSLKLKEYNDTLELTVYNSGFNLRKKQLH